MVRSAWVVVLLFVSACARYWVRPAELTQARITQAPTVEVIRDYDGELARVPVDQLLELTVTPRADGRVLVVDRRARQRHRRRLLLGVGLTAFHIGATLVGVGAAFVATWQPCASPGFQPGTNPFGCLDLSLDKVGWGFIGAGIAPTLAGIVLTVAGARTRIPPEPSR